MPTDPGRLTPDRRDSDRAHVCLLATADWDAPLWTNKQYMARELGMAHDVTYVESIGLRRPRPSLADIRRITARLRRSDHGGRPPERGVAVVRPLTIPIHHAATRRVNERLLARTVADWIGDGTRPRVLWTYSPLTYGLEQHAERVVYHAVDLLGAYPGIPASLIEDAERRLARHGAMAIASSAVVRAHLERVGFADVLDWPNVAEVAPFAAAASTTTGRSRRIVFGGNITPYKVDLHLVERLAVELPSAELVLAGPLDEGGAGAWADPRRLERQGVTLTGTLTVDELAALYATAAVGIIPYVANDYTHGVNPLKLFEYVAAGLAVVSTPVPSVAELAEQGAIGPDDLRVETDPDLFVAAVDKLAHAPDQQTAARRTALAAEHSWERRGGAARDLIGALVCPR